MTVAEQQQHRFGLALVAMAAIAWSTSGLFVRLITADLMTMLFWRGIFSGGAMMLLFFFIERAKAWAILGGLKWPALAVAVLSALGMITGIGALRYTSIADAMVIYATVPFVTAGIAYVFIGEKPARSTMVASVVALAGVAIMMWGSAWGGSLFGKALALTMAFCMAGFTTIMRRHRDVAMLPAIGISAWLCSLFCWFFAEPLGVSARDLGLLALFGVVQNAAGLALYTFASRRIPAAEATLIAAMEVPLAPLWVWLFLGEASPPQTLLGGAVVLTALFGHILVQFRSSTQSDAQPFRAAP
ncbi:MAG: DMT family transporter [Rhizobiales bacterium]|nr:DMT family transporter [Hyphomicrobiales bacterium]